MCHPLNVELTLKVVSNREILLYLSLYKIYCIVSHMHHCCVEWTFWHSVLLCLTVWIIWIESGVVVCATGKDLGDLFTVRD